MNETLKNDLNKTPLHALHVERGAKMVPFAGWEMPLQFEGIIAEHLHARSQAVLFDVSHMGQAVLYGDNPAESLETLVPGEIQKLANDHQRYTVLTNAEGGILDDLMVTRRGDRLFMVVNAACREADFEYIRTRLEGQCTLEPQPDRALLALQGPTAVNALARLAPAARYLMFMHSQPLSIGNIPSVVSRSGYTGEDGFEISVEATDAEALARLLLSEPEVRPGGLGARDTLRLEAGFCLYGNDIDETTTPVEAGLAWTIGKRRRTEGGFPGAEIIQRQLAEGVQRRRVGIILDGRIPARAHAAVEDQDGAVVGEVTSGAYGPSVDSPVALAYVKTEYGEPKTPVNVVVRDQRLPGRVTALPFVEHKYVH